MASELNKEDLINDMDQETETAAETENAQDSAPAEDEVDYSKEFNAKIIVVTSGKGGVGKTTSSASISSGLALEGKKTAVIDFDVGLRNLDLVMGCERRVVYDLVNVIKKEATLRQALIKDKNSPNLYILPASQTRDKDALTKEGVYRILRELDTMGFDYIICDSPAGIETGALMALYFADIAIVTTNPEISSVRDSDRIIGILDSKSRRAEFSMEPIKPYLLLTRYDPARVDGGHMLSVDEVVELLSIELIGVIPESKSVLDASNQGKPTVYIKGSDAGMAYMDTVKRILGQQVDIRFTQKIGLFKRLLGKK
jgi:septum site-determining protein MinD